VTAPSHVYLAPGMFGLSSGSRFTRVRFDPVMDRVADGMLLAEDLRARPARQAARAT